jgi:hypothetical protein
MADIEITNAEILTEDEKKVMNKLLNEYYSKIQRMTKTPIKLKIDVKEYDKEGEKCKYSLNSQLIFSGKMLSSSSWDWDLTRAIHKAMKKIESEAEHKWKETK